MSKFTPGPWYVGVCHVGETCWCRTVGTDPASDDMKDCVIPSGSVSAENASLIAAAPDLLEALQGLMSISSYMDQNESPSEYAAARAAIAKATGAGHE